VTVTVTVAVTAPAVLLALSVVVGVLSWRRSARSLTRYRLYTGAPVIWLLLGAGSLVALVAAAAGRPDLTAGLLAGALLGTGLVQVVLLRRTGGPAPDDR
jgi:hypothetical protein